MSEITGSSREPFENSLDLHLGDIIFITNPSRPDLNKKTFLIEYIDERKIKLVREDSRQIILRIHDGIIGDGTIQNISIESRSEYPGYAMQNDLVPGKWINIYFRGEYSLVITGEITNLIEDMIEVKTYPEEETIYIDFGYRGIPEDLNIENILTTTPPPQLPQDFLEEAPTSPQISSQASPQILDEEIFPENALDIDVEDDEHLRQVIHKNPEAQPIKDFAMKSKQLILKADQVVFGNYMEEIVETKNVSSQFKRYSLEVQTTDLLDEMLSEIPLNRQTRNVLNGVHRMIERFVQLRNEFSRFDDDGNVCATEIKGSDYRPLAESLLHLDKSLPWIILVAQNIKKLYMRINEEDNIPTGSNFKVLNIMTENAELINLTNNYKNKTLDNENNYLSFIRQLSSFMTPFDNPSFEEYTQSIINIDNVKDNYPVLINNNENNFETPVVTDELNVKKNLMMRYNDSSIMSLNNELIPLFKSDIIYLRSIVTLPEPVIRYSSVKLPGTNIMTKSNLALIDLPYFSMLKSIQTVPVETHLTDFLINPPERNPSPFYDETFGENTKNFTIDMSIIQENADKHQLYKNYLNTIVPRTKNLFHLMKRYIKGQLSLVSIINVLEPFLIYSTDITFQQYVEMSAFIKEQILLTIRHFIERGKIYQTLKTNSYYYENSSSNLIATMLQQKKYYYDIVAKSYEYRPSDTFFLTNSELLSRIIQLDYGNVYNTTISLFSDKLINASIGSRLTQEMDSLLDEFENTQFSKCKNLTIAKTYKNIDDLKLDNDKVIYYDRGFDKTPYKIMEVFEKERRTMSPDSFVAFLKDKLKNKYPEENLDEFVENIIYGAKKVRDFDAAILFNERRDTLNYYTRQNNEWILKDAEDMGNTTELSCLLSESCIMQDEPPIELKEIHARVDGDCVSYEQSQADFNLSTVNNMVKQYDAKYERDIQKQVQETNSALIYYVLSLQKIRSYTNFLQIKYTVADAYIGLDNIDIFERPSPYLHLRDLILGQIDFVKKQRDILTFIEKFGVEYDKDEEENHWYYCKETSTKLIPKFFGILAKVYIETPGEYEKVLDLVCAKYGKLSDDGDKYVDKNSGFTIRYIDFAKEDEYVEGMKQTKTSLEEDLGDIYVKNANIQENRKKYDAMDNLLMRIVQTVEEFMHIDIDSQHEFILSVAKRILITLNGTEKQYDASMKDKQGKKEKVPYKTFVNRNNLYLTLAVTWVAIQTHQPSVRSRYNFPGCVRSFDGFPLTDKNEKGLTYLSCVVNNIKTSIEPWNVLRLKKDAENAAKLHEKIKFYISRYLITDNTVKNKLEEKRLYISEEPEEEVVIKSHTMWLEFLPALVPFHLKRVSPLSPHFIEDFHALIRRGGETQEKIETIESKIILFSYEFQECIQKIVSQKILLLKTSQNVPFMDNACCNDAPLDNNVIGYFIKDDPYILKLIEYTTDLRAVLTDIIRMTKSRTWVSNINSKTLPLPIQNNYTETVIIKTLIFYCRYFSNYEPPPYLSGYCLPKPDYIQHDDSYTVKVEKLIEHGFKYNNEIFLKFIQEIGRNNRIDIAFSKIYHLTDNLNILLDKTPVLPTIPELVRTLMNKYSEGQNINTRELNNRLFEINKQYRTQLLLFIGQNTKISREKFKDIEKTINELSLWTGDKGERKVDNFFFMKMNFYKGLIYTFSRVFPNIIIKKIDYRGMSFGCKHWDLSENDMTKVNEIIKSYYQPLSTFYSAFQYSRSYTNLEQESYTIFDNLLQNIVSNTAFYYKMSEFTPFVSSFEEQEQKQTDEFEMIKIIFGEITSLMLFENYFLSVLNEYVVQSANSPNVYKQHRQLDAYALSSQEALEEETTLFTDMPVSDLQSEMISTQNMKQIRNIIANLLVVYMDYTFQNKSIQNITYENIMERSYTLKEKEKILFTDRLEKLNDEQAEIDNILKSHHLGVWNKGLQKGLTRYVKEYTEEDREFEEYNKRIEKSLLEKEGVNDRNVEQYRADALDDFEADEFMDNEANRMDFRDEDYRNLYDEDDDNNEEY